MDVDSIYKSPFGRFDELSAEICEQLSFEEKFLPAFGGVHEIPVSMGEGIGVLTDAQNAGIDKKTDAVVARHSRF